MGAGVRIAILDSGVDATHPDIAPNLVLNVSEVNQDAQLGLPSICDDGSAQDQQGHGTWAASLAAGAIGPGTGGVIGVAPHASLMNVKVLERLPSTEGGTAAARCEAGQAGGLLSWVLLGMDDAITHKASIVSLSLGSVVDLNSGDGAGWKAAFDRVTHAATLAGVVVIAAVGNDGIDLSGRYAELPAQAREVLAVVAATNAACVEDLSPAAAVCVPGAVTRPYYSNYGVRGAIAAPGGSYPNVSENGINGWVRGACSSSGCFHLGSSTYVQAIGTSASVPLVAGVAALLRSAHPSWTAAQTVAAIRSSATATSAMAEPQVNAAAALALP